jgi:ATP/maltotriose-dependent transcriptional regulator MalT
MTEGLALLPEGEQSAERAKLLSQLAKRRMLQGRLAEAEECAREAIAVARAVGHRESEAIALNALGTAMGERGETDAGVEHLRESLDLAREEDLPMEVGGAWINIADTLNLAGRTEEALAAARQGLEAGRTSPWRTSDWLRLAVSDYSFQLGYWDEAEAAIPGPSRRHTGGTFVYWQVCRAQLALARGDVALAEEAIAALAEATAGSTEPQFIGAYGALSSELARRVGDIDGARAAVDDGLDRIEYCSEDLVRISALAVTGLRVEGDAGQLARDRRDEAASSVAQSRAEALLERTRLAAESGWAVEAPQLATAKAEYARATGGDSGPLWAGAAERWEQLRRPYQSSYTRWREAEALMTSGDREGAARAGTAALESSRGLGSAWLVDEIESLAARARLQLGGEVPPAAAEPAQDEPEDPFGLTARERDVLALVAAGATNREIGERLHMAEKTASVHVSRILAKLNVRSRTEAAAVAHRQGLVTTA